MNLLISEKNKRAGHHIVYDCINKVNIGIYDANGTAPVSGVSCLAYSGA